MSAKPFYLFIVDHDNKVFTKIGPMNDDTSWISRVVAMQKKGRNINCFNVNTKDISGCVQEYETQKNYKFTSNIMV